MLSTYVIGQQEDSSELYVKLLSKSCFKRLRDFFTLYRSGYEVLHFSFKYLSNSIIVQLLILVSYPLQVQIQCYCFSKCLHSLTYLFANLNVRVTC